ncbi:alanine--tRNA ligase [Sedimentibacter sp. zth1]|uniref:alanine--tRNA ligase n=1 Tax=Sedimentibacter sp. zth1 TaxID=2816908 RepID=UPI001A9352AC|nr:alanine--tRNA ligase [Sedimentibacter sp. zth1]QSX06433.1 alanine--tRNA ligase [Sedimentibacter sp. zth1]
MENKYSINNIREQYLDFYRSKGHLIEQSASLIPKNDKTLLLVAAGMAPLKKYFTGAETPPSKRMSTCQKCVRTNDMENVGVTARHLTFFEMLGNFSFGDYFKKEAITWAWEFLTKRMEIPAEKLWATVYIEDEEAIDLWTSLTEMPRERIVKLGKEDNFWELEVGPSGPSSEIYFDKGAEFGCGSPDCKPGCDCDRYTEIWNLVFTQFDKDENGVYNPLEHPNIDTGMGLERVAMTLQGKETVFDVEPLYSVIKKAEEISDVKYKTNLKNDTSIKIIADHSRALSFLIGDGVIPSNEGRGYVLRRLIRRALRQGKLLGIDRDFLTETVQVVIDEWSHAYPELKEKESYILKVVKIEEEKFRKTIDQGLEMLQKEINNAKQNGHNKLDGQITFKLYDTFGFPYELTEEILAENNFEFDKQEFLDIMEEHRIMARESRGKAGSSGWKDSEINVEGKKTEFVGYDNNSIKSKVSKIFVDNKEAKEISIGEKGIIALSSSPFYAEMGGQIGDTGKIFTKDFEATVLNTKKLNNIFIHEVIVDNGIIKLNEDVTAKIDVFRRKNIAKNHTATHILHKVLKEVLGDHVNQAGSLVTEDRLRFDYTHFEMVDENTLKEIEKRVNDEILKDYKVITDVVSLEEAKAQGAMALFDEKYGDVVRLVKVGDFSKELCGGTHIDETAKIGMFKILSEGGIASGVRRIEAVTGKAAIEYLNNIDNIVSELMKSLKATKDEIVNKVSVLKKEVKDRDKEIAKLNNEILKSNMDDILNNFDEINGVKVYSIKLKNTDANTLRDIADKIKDKNPSCVIVLASEVNEKVIFVASVTKDLIQKGIQAGNIVKKAASVAGGGGGGRPDFAQAGGKDVTKIDEALKKAKEGIINQLN